MPSLNNSELTSEFDAMDAVSGLDAFKGLSKLEENQKPTPPPPQLVAMKATCFFLNPS